MTLRCGDVFAAIISSGSGMDMEILATAEDLATCTLLFLFSSGSGELYMEGNTKEESCCRQSYTCCGG